MINVFGDIIIGLVDALFLVVIESFIVPLAEQIALSLGVGV